MSAKNKLPPSIETALSELGELVSQMEKGNLSLEESLNHFERGIHIAKNCQQTLQEAKQRVQILIEKNGEASLENSDETS